MTKYIRVYAKLPEWHFNVSLSSNHGETDLNMHETRIWECNVCIINKCASKKIITLKTIKTGCFLFWSCLHSVKRAGCMSCQRTLPEQLPGGWQLALDPRLSPYQSDYNPLMFGASKKSTFPVHWTHDLFVTFKKTKHFIKLQAGLKCVGQCHLTTRISPWIIFSYCVPFVFFFGFLTRSP